MRRFYGAIFSNRCRGWSDLRGSSHLHHTDDRCKRHHNRQACIAQRALCSEVKETVKESCQDAGLFCCLCEPYALAQHRRVDTLPHLTELPGYTYLPETEVPPKSWKPVGLALVYTGIALAGTSALSHGDLGSSSMREGGTIGAGIVKKSWVPGERRDYYEPETSIWKMVSRVFRERELRQIHTAIEAFEQVVSALGRRRKTAGLEEVQRIDFALGRIGSLLDLARICEKLLSAILAGEPVDAGPLAAFAKDKDRG